MSLFKLGSIVATPGALQFCKEHSIDTLGLIGRHVGGDFGDLDADDVAANVHGIKHDLRVFSAYQFKHGKVWVITEADRSSTCLLLPSEY